MYRAAKFRCASWMGAWLAAVLWVGVVHAQSNCGIRVGDELLAVNTRPAACSTNPIELASKIEVERLIERPTCGCEWVAADWGDFLGANDGRITVIYLHGNQETHCDAQIRGLAVYRSLTRCAGDGPNIRFVIWSWPSSEVQGMLRDYREKARRTRPVGWQLAWGLDQLPPDQPVSLLGYSYGARVIGGACHVLAGGRLSGLGLESNISRPRSPMPTVFLAAATHSHWFGPGQYHGRAMQQIDSLLLVNNRRDPAMRFYDFVDQGDSAQALGLCGPTRLPSHAVGRVVNIDATSAVGASHDLYRYIGLRDTMAKAWVQLTQHHQMAVVAQ